MYDLILFDADGTLFDYDRAEKFALEESLKVRGYTGDFIALRNHYREINFRLWSELEKGIITKEKLRSERFKRLFAQYNLSYNIDDFSDYYLNKLGEGSFLIEGAEKLCKDLKPRYRLAILTNGIYQVQLSRLNFSSIKEYIEDIVVSEKVGVNKPDPYIFEYALDRLNCKDKEKVLMVGDSLSADIKGGNNFGIDTCWLNHNRIKKTEGIKPKYIIESLSMLSEILK